jgi:hypothetical protein
MYCKPESITATLILLTIVLVPVLAAAEKAPAIPPGTTIRVRIIDSLNSGTTQSGDTFHGTLDQPIMADGRELYPRGADVTGRVSDVHRSGRLSEPGELDLVLATIASGHMASSLEVEPLVIKATSHTKSNATKIGGGAALGAIIGTVAGGGKGAAIGAGVGGAAGTGAAAATGKREAIVESEAILSFVTTQSSAVNDNASSTTSSGTQTPSENSTVDQNAPRSNPPNKNQPGANRPDNNQSDADQSDMNQPSGSDSLTYAFSARDRRVIRNCVSEHASDLPAGITQREELPSGSERSVKSGGTLPRELEKQAQSLPLPCEQQLPRLPKELERVVYNGRVLLINDTTNRILDLFYLDETQ